MVEPWWWVARVGLSSVTSFCLVRLCFFILFVLGRYAIFVPGAGGLQGRGFGIGFVAFRGMKKSTTDVIIRELEDLIRKGNAHVSFEDAVEGVSPSIVGEVPDGLPYSLWQLVEHIRITQWDILEFSRNPKYQSPAWPEGYWPTVAAPADERDPGRAVERIVADREEFIGLLQAAGERIYEPFAHGHGQSLFREALLIADHTSYHTAEIVVLRRLLKDWK